MFFLEFFFVNYSQSGDLSIGSCRKNGYHPLGKKLIRQIWLEIKILTTHLYFSLYIFMATHTENPVKKSSHFYEFFSSLVGFEASKIISFVFLWKKSIWQKNSNRKVWEAKQPLFLTGEISPNCIIKIQKKWKWIDFGGFQKARNEF